MQFSIETLGPLQRRITVDLPEDRISGEIQGRLKELAQRAQIPGFRRGKAPLQIVARRYGPQVREEVISDVVSRSFREAVQKEQLRVAGDPVVDPLKAEPGAGLSYAATFEVYPAISLADLGGVSVAKPVCDITEAEMDKMIENLRRQHRHFHMVDRPAQAGDKVKFDSTGSLEDGSPFAQATGEGFSYELGTGGLLPGLDEGLTGLAAGSQRTVDVRVPEEFHDKNLAGKSAKFEVHMREVLEPHLPDLNAAFFQELGINEPNEEQFRAEVRQHMERERDQNVRSQLKEQVMNALLAAHPLEVPRALVTQESLVLLEDFRERMRGKGLASSGLNKIGPEMFTERAQRRVHLGLILGEIIKVAGLKADPAKVRGLVEILAASYQEPGAVVNWYYEDRQRLAQVEAAVLEDEVVAWVLQRVQLQAQPVAFEALVQRKDGETQDAA